MRRSDAGESAVGGEGVGRRRPSSDPPRPVRRRRGGLTALLTAAAVLAAATTSGGGRGAAAAAAFRFPRLAPRPPAPLPLRAASCCAAASTAPVLAAASPAAESALGAVELRHAEYSAASSGHDHDLHDPVIILHGLLGSKRNFASLASSLSSQLRVPRRVLAVDLRNHGDNLHDWRTDMSYPSMARDVLAVMDREGIDRAVLVGHSMGGKVAASLSLLEPERVGGLVVLDVAPVRYCPARDASWGAVKASIDAIAKVELNNGDGSCATKRDVDVALRSALEDPALRAFVLTNLDQDRGKGGGGELRWKVNVEAICDQLDVIAGFDLLGDEANGFGSSNLPSDDEDLPGRRPRRGGDAAAASGGNAANNLPADDDDQPDPAANGVAPNGATANNDGSGNADGDAGGGPELRYHGDVFIIAGGSSRFVRQSHLPVISSYFPNYMLTTVRGAGHWVHAEAPDDTLALLKRYLDR